MLATSISSYVSTASDATWATLNANMVAAFNIRYDSGRVQGISDVRSSPNSYSLYTHDQYSAYGSTCYNNGVSAGKASTSVIQSATYAIAPSTAGTTYSFGNLTKSYTTTMTCPSNGLVIAVGGGSGRYHSVGYSCTNNGVTMSPSLTINIGYAAIGVYTFNANAGSVIQCTSSITFVPSDGGGSDGPSMINGMRLYTYS